MAIPFQATSISEETPFRIVSRIILHKKKTCQTSKMQIDSSTIDGKVEFVHSQYTTVFLRHKCQLSFCVRQNY